MQTQYFRNLPVGSAPGTLQSSSVILHDIRLFLTARGPHNVSERFENFLTAGIDHLCLKALARAVFLPLCPQLVVVATSLEGVSCFCDHAPAL